MTFWLTRACRSGQPKCFLTIVFNEYVEAPWLWRPPGQQPSLPSPKSGPGPIWIIQHFNEVIPDSTNIYNFISDGPTTQMTSVELWNEKQSSQRRQRHSDYRIILLTALNVSQRFRCSVCSTKIRQIGCSATIARCNITTEYNEMPRYY